MTRETLKKTACEAIDRRSDELITLAKHLQGIPELGFKEFKTAAKVKQVLESFGLSCRDGLAITGVKAKAKGRSAGPNICLMSELDALAASGHVKADPATGNAHACGHHAQMAAMLGAAMGLIPTGVMSQLDGDITFFSVPAEEFVELQYRTELKRQGKIHFLAGKPELIRLGEMDDLDIVIMAHATGAPAGTYLINHNWNGAYAKMVRFIGKAAHAGACPEEGVNALNAAMAAMMCIHAQRETFRDEDHIRVHPIITKGGELVNIVPDDVRMETFVRGIRLSAMIDANKKVNRAIRGAAMAVGAQVKITELGGYMPFNSFSPMEKLYGENAALLTGRENIIDGGMFFASTDVGDLSALKPLVHAMFGGFAGELHTSDFDAEDDYAAYVQPAKVAAMTVIDLLADGALKAEEIINAYTPTYPNANSYVAACEDALRDDAAQ